jgi:hypothetical protein
MAAATFSAAEGVLRLKQHRAEPLRADDLVALREDIAL